MKAKNTQPKFEKFFFSIAPHFENDLLQEMIEVFPFLVDSLGRPVEAEFPEHEVVVGGVELLTDFLTALQLQLFLKTPHRLLWRCDEFKATEFPTLMHKLKGSRLGQLKKLAKGFDFSKYEFKVSASESRLGQEKRILACVLEALGEPARAKAGSAESFTKSIYIRLFKDLVQISFDLSGDHLHFRGYATSKGEAPLRETWAALFVRKFVSGYSLAELQKVNLLDPFVGSGTLLFEAALLFQPLWPGLNTSRKYSGLEFLQTPKILRSESFFKNYKTHFPFIFSQLIGFEMDQRTFGALQDNAKKLREYFAGAPEFNFQNLDSLKSSVANSNWIFTNPPYGDRLKGELNLRTVEGLQKFIARLLKNFNPTRMGLFLPNEAAAQFPRAAMTSFLSEHRLKWCSSTDFSNGGIHCSFSILEKTFDI